MRRLVFPTIGGAPTFSCMLLDLYIPPRCAVCQRETDEGPLCRRCTAHVEAQRLTDDGRCPVCWFNRIGGNCPFCSTRHVFFDAHRSLYPLSSAWRAVLRSWKFANARSVC